jgi:large subunit ribosomal protein L34e
VKRVFTRTPTGRGVIHYKAERPSKLACRICGSLLGGVNNARRGAKSKRVPTRVFAGQLCAGCTAKIVTMKSRIALGEMKPEDASQAQREFIRMLK